MIICLVFYTNLKFLATYVRAGSENDDLCSSSVDSSRRESRLSNSIPKIKTQIRQIGGFSKTISKHGRVWA